MTARQDKVNAFLHQLSHIKVVRIHKRSRRDAEHVARMQAFRHSPCEELHRI